MAAVEVQRIIQLGKRANSAEACLQLKDNVITFSKRVFGSDSQQWLEIVVELIKNPYEGVLSIVYKDILGKNLIKWKDVPDGLQKILAQLKIIPPLDALSEVERKESLAAYSMLASRLQDDTKNLPISRSIGPEVQITHTYWLQNYVPYCGTQISGTIELANWVTANDGQIQMALQAILDLVKRRADLVWWQEDDYAGRSVMQLLSAFRSAIKFNGDYSKSLATGLALCNQLSAMQLINDRGELGHFGLFLMLIMEWLTNIRKREEYAHGKKFVPFLEEWSLKDSSTFVANEARVQEKARTILSYIQTVAPESIIAKGRMEELCQQAIAQKEHLLFETIYRTYHAGAAGDDNRTTVEKHLPEFLALHDQLPASSQHIMLTLYWEISKEKPHSLRKHISFFEDHLSNGDTSVFSAQVLVELSKRYPKDFIGRGNEYLEIETNGVFDTHSILCSVYAKIASNNEDEAERVIALTEQFSRTDKADKNFILTMLKNLWKPTANMFPRLLHGRLPYLRQLQDNLEVKPAAQEVIDIVEQTSLINIEQTMLKNREDIKETARRVDNTGSRMGYATNNYSNQHRDLKNAQRDIQQQNQVVQKMKQRAQVAEDKVDNIYCDALLLCTKFNELDMNSLAAGLRSLGYKCRVQAIDTATFPLINASHAVIFCVTQHLAQSAQALKLITYAENSDVPIIPLQFEHGRWPLAQNLQPTRMSRMFPVDCTNVHADAEWGRQEFEDVLQRLEGFIAGKEHRPFHSLYEDQQIADRLKNNRDVEDFDDNFSDALLLCTNFNVPDMQALAKGLQSLGYICRIEVVDDASPILIDSSHVAIVCVTQHFAQSPHALKLVQHADEMSKPIIPLQFEDGRWPLDNNLNHTSLPRTLPVDCTSVHANAAWGRAEFEDVLQRLEGYVGSNKNIPPVPSSRSPTSRSPTSRNTTPQAKLIKSSTYTQLAPRNANSNNSIAEYFSTVNVKYYNVMHLALALKNGTPTRTNQTPNVRKISQPARTTNNVKRNASKSPNAADKLPRINRTPRLTVQPPSAPAQRSKPYGRHARGQTASSNYGANYRPQTTTLRRSSLDRALLDSEMPKLPSLYRQRNHLVNH